MRAHDGQRNSTIGELRTAYQQGALSTNTFTLRVERALEARESGQLRALVADLPAPDWGRRLRAEAGAVARRLTREHAPPASARILALETLPPVALLGRGSLCAVRLSDPAVSRRHACLERDGDQWWLRDLSSRNGTWLWEGQVVDPVAVRPGDELRLGDTVLRLAR